MGDYVGQSVRDSVEEGNYTYYTLKQAGDLELVLTSLEGDADLYISSEVEQPTYLFQEHGLSSTTCGEDRVPIAASMPRPIFIAVYGHPRYHTSEYNLDVVIVERGGHHDPFQEEPGEGEEEDEGSRGYPGTARGPGHHQRKEEESPYRLIWSVLRSILEILIDVVI